MDGFSLQVLATAAMSLKKISDDELTTTTLFWQVHCLWKLTVSGSSFEKIEAISIKRAFSSSFVHICSFCERSPSSRFDNIEAMSMNRVFSSSFVHICSVCERSPSSRFDNSWCAGERSLGLPTDGWHAGVSVRGGGRAGSCGGEARVASPAAGEVEPGHPAVEDEGDADEDALQSVDYGEDVAQNDHLAWQNR